MNNNNSNDKKVDLLPQGLEKPRRENKQPNTLVRLIGEIDRPFFILVLVLLGIGCVMVFSASYSYAKTWYLDSYFFARKQILYAVAGIGIMMVIAKFIRHTLVKRFAYIGLLVALGLNAMVIAYGFIAGGAQRWIEIGGITLQPSELLKFFIIVACAKYISENQEGMKTFKKGILPFAVLAVPCVIILIMQKHLSATIITLLIIFAMMFIGGSNLTLLTSIAAVGVGIAVFVSTNIDYILKLDIIQTKLSHVYKRLLVWQNPFAYMKDAETGDAGWQPAQSLYAISSGGFWGVGLGKSMQKHAGYLPEPQTDYIFAILCEELGFSGAIAVICLFMALFFRGFHIAKKSNDKFCSLVVMGLMIKLAIHVILNIAVVTNIMPSTGISLPFFSYGVTVLLVTLAEMGIVLSISRYSYVEKG